MIAHVPIFYGRRPSLSTRYGSLLICLGMLSPSLAQISPLSLSNYVIEQTPRTAQTTVNLSSPYSDVPATISYFDGLGRPTQTVQLRAAGDASLDIITKAITYDTYGRANKSYLPMPGGVGGGYLGNLQQAAQGTYNDANPYAETVYEASPLKKPSQQWGAGVAWRTNNRNQQISYHASDLSGTAIIRFKVNYSTNVIYGHLDGNNAQFDTYGPHDLNVRVILDEQGHQTKEYVDLQGRFVRRDVDLGGTTLSTLYVYDSYERLAAVIPPKLYNWFLDNGSAQELPFYLNTNPATPNPQFQQNAFVYQYDGRGRVIRKHIPSAGWTELVYDQLDRLVMSQDQQDQAGGYWRYIKYDGLNRVVESGRLSLNRSPTDLRTDFVGVTQQNFPGTVNPQAGDQLMLNRYDDYSQISLTYQVTGAFTAPYPSASGLLTGSNVRNLETLAWYESAYWYDDKGRVVQQQRQNHLGGTDRTDYEYRFNGELLQTVLRHQNGSTVTQETTRYDYDHVGRRTSLSYQLGNDSARLLARYTYDGLGRLSQKQLEPPQATGATIQRSANPPTATTQDVATQYIEITPENFDVNLQANPSGQYEARIGSGSGLQTLDYRYHLRGWLRGVNVDASGQPVLDAGRRDAFGFGLDYETANYFDGNIGRQRWLGSRQPAQTRQYTYSYDAASRLTSASYAGATGEDYALSNLTYDSNGNLQSLNRAGIDQLSYSYGVGNQLNSVSDASGNTGGFTDGNTAGNDYDYWPDGSLKYDLNRGITDIQYNLLKLPRQVSFSSGKTVSYQYDADGRKLAMIASTGEIRDYVGPFQYLNGSLFEVSHEEGRVVAGSPNTYEYYHKDHLGNIRAVVSADGNGGVTVNQWVDFDPWGLELSGLVSGTSTNRLRFNGKEAVSELGSGLLDFGARGYDAQIGRFRTVDRYAEKYPDLNGYHYVANNPVLNIDPTGDTLAINYVDASCNTQRLTYGFKEGSYDSNGEASGGYGFYQADGTLYKGTDKFVSEVNKALARLGVGKEGRATIDKVTSDKQTVEIVQRNNNYDPTTKTVGFNPTSNALIPTEGSSNGLAASRSFISLGHELSHAEDDLSGTINTAQTWIGTLRNYPEAEKFATHRENQFRAENGLPLRTHYGVMLDLSTNIQSPDPLSSIIDSKGNSLFYKQTNYRRR